MCRIAPLLCAGSRIRLKGKGVVSMKQPGTYGDMQATVQVHVPKGADATGKAERKELMRHVEEAAGAA